MAKLKLGVVVGPNRRESINRKLGDQGLHLLGGEAYIQFKPAAQRAA